MITVTITVTDVPNNAPAFDAATADRMVDENMPAGTNVGDPVTATDEGDDDDGTLAYSLSGDGAMYFDIDDMGQISTEMMLDHEAMASHMVTVSDGLRRRVRQHHGDDRGRRHVPGLHGHGQQRPDERL